MKDSKRILIIGFGSIARKHVRILNQNWPSFEIGIYKKGFFRESDELNLCRKKFTTYQECIEWRPNYVIIASPCSFHLDQALFFAGQGIPTFIEKPIGKGNESKSSCDELFAFSKTVPIMIGYVFRHDECLKELENILSLNSYGEIIEVESYCGSWLPDWRQNSDYKKSVSAQNKFGGGVFLELSHEIDLINYLFGPIEIKYASSMNTNSLEIDVEDIALIHAECLSCKFLTVKLNFCTKPQERYIKIRFSNANITWELNNQIIRIKEPKAKESILYKSENDLDYKYVKQFENFFKFAENIESCHCSVIDAFETLNLICNAKKISSKN